MDPNEAGTSGTNDDGEEEAPPDTILISDHLKNQEEIMEKVAAVLGAADDFSCTYSQGYLKRQPLYACLTCIPEAQSDFNKSAGICLACSYHCHDSHDLIELYTKRNFRCDCGNKKFADGKCNMQAEKDDLNELNLYNQNFSGVYCTCAKPYPDPEDTVDDEMTQCVVCEDWYHSRHLNAPVPNNYAEMVCSACVKLHRFFLHYGGLTATEVGRSETDADVNVEADEKAKEKNGAAVVGGEANCKRPLEKNCADETTMFMADFNWREMICKCKDCLEMYEKEKVEFLLDPMDPVQAYEEKGKAKFQEMEQKALQREATMIKSFDRVAMIEMMTGLNEFKDELGTFFKKFAVNKRVIKLEDVEEFFNELQSRRKKQKVDIPPYYCR